jgi:uncharacterized protein HemX
MINDMQQKGSANWLLIVLLVVAVVLSICFYTQKRIIETDRDNLAAEIQSTKQTTSSLESSQREMDTVKKEKDDLIQQLIVATDSIAQLQKNVEELKKQLSSVQKKTTPIPKKPIAKSNSKSTVKKTRK